MLNHIDKFYEKHSFIIKLIVIVCITVLVLLGGYMRMGKYRDINIFNVAAGPKLTKAIENGDVIEQEFSINDEGTNSVMVLFATYNTTITKGTVNVIVSKNGEIVNQYEFSAAEIYDNQYKNIEINENGEKADTGHYKLSLSFEDIGQQSIHLYLSDENVYQEYDLYINGIKSDADLGMRLKSDKYDLFMYSYFMVVIASLIVMIVAYYLIYKYKKQICYVYLVVGIFFGIVYLLLLPVSVVPDEPSHMHTAYSMSNSILGIESSGEGVVMRYDDSVIGLRATDIKRSYYNDYFSKFFNAFIDNDELVQTANESVRAIPYGYLYLPGAIGITIGRILGLGTMFTYLLGRLINLAIFIGVTFYSLKKIPFGKTLLFLWALLPITLQQVASFSYDSTMFSLCILVISMSLRLAYEREENIKRIERVVLFICIMLLFPVKSFAMIPLCALPLIIYFTKKDNKKTNGKYILVMYITAIVFATVAVLVVNNVGTNASESVEQGENYIEWAKQEGYTLSYLLKNPKQLFMVLWNTVYERGDFYLKTFLGNSLGWFELNIPIFVTFPYLILMILAALKRSEEELFLKKVIKLYFCVLAILGAGFAAGGMLLNWTPITYQHIEGVQGRYFLPFALLAMLAIRSERITVDKQVDSKLMFSGIWLSIIAIMCLYVRAV